MGMAGNLAEKLRQQAIDFGFTACAFTTPDAIPEAAGRLAEFLKAGYNGQMGWLAERSHWRGDPTSLWPEARSVIMLAEAYTPTEDPLTLLDHPDRAAISVYARNRDYHDLVKKRLKRLGRWLIAQESCEIKVFVDTAPVMEKPLAAAAGLGWQGKHTNLVSREMGSWFFLGAIFTTLSLPPDAPEIDHCGSCTRCLDICPTKAFPAPYKIDARRCISYLTIEHHGEVDEELRPLLGNRIYGCDDCLAVCPWNKYAAATTEMGYWPRIELTRPKLAHFVCLSDAEFREVFAGSPIKRIGRNRFVRNVLYAIGNSSEAGLIPYASRLLDDADPVVQDAARWAVTRLKAKFG